MHVFVILKSNPDQQLFVTHLLCGEISPFVVNVTVMLQTVLALLQTVALTLLFSILQHCCSISSRFYVLASDFRILHQR
jgi:hypothetical protein